MAVPSRVMRSASHAGTRPPWSGRSAKPERFILYFIFADVALRPSPLTRYFGRFQEGGKDGTIAANLAAGHSGSDESQLKFPEVVLPFQLPVDGDENVKPLLSVSQQRAIRRAAPAGFADGRDRVSRKGRPDPDVHTLV